MLDEGGLLLMQLLAMPSVGVNAEMTDLDRLSLWLDHA